MVEKKIGSHELDSIEELMKEFQKCSDIISKKMSVKGSKINQIVNNISLNKIIEASKLLVCLKTKEIDNLKYSLREE